MGENPYENAFKVDIKINKFISKLRDTIKKKIDNNVKAKDFKL
jgi:hypothetical protein